MMFPEAQGRVGRGKYRVVVIMSSCNVKRIKSFRWGRKNNGSFYSSQRTMGKEWGGERGRGGKTLAMGS